MGQKIQETEQGTKTTLWKYKAGRLESITTPNQVVITHAYDSLGRLKGQKSTDGSIQYQFTYDLNDNLLFVEDMVNHTQTHRSYDTLNRLIHEKQATGFDISYQYDNQNRIQEVNFENTKITHSYSPTTLLASSRHKNGQLLYTCSHRYDGRGKVLRSHLPHTTLKYRWDLAGRCQHIDSPSFTQNLSYDALGRLIYTEVEDFQGSYEAAFTYDGLDQLVSEIGPFINQYTYDSIQNRRSHNANPLKLDLLNQVTQTDTDRYSYDLNGQRTTKNNASYTYDALGRLLQYKQGSEQITYLYDPLGRRVRSTTSGDTTDYHYQFDKEIGCQNATASQFRLLQGHGISAIELDGELYTPIRNHRGDICQLLDALGTPVSTTRYDAFGNFIQYGLTCPWALSGQRYDTKTSLYHFDKREYDPAIGRWLTSDPLHFADGPNLYAYVHNNPLTFVDPYGLWGEEAFQFSDGFHRGGCDVLTMGATVEAFGEYHPPTRWAEWGYTTGKGAGNLVHTLLPIGKTVWVKNGIFAVVKNLVSKHVLKEASKNAEKNLLKKALGIDKKDKNIQNESGSRKRFEPDSRAEGDHSRFRKDPHTGKTDKYETFKPQTNPYDPKSWESVKRYDGIGNQHTHYNKNLDQHVSTPHVHDPNYPGGVRSPEPWEIP